MVRSFVGKVLKVVLVTALVTGSLTPNAAWAATGGVEQRVPDGRLTSTRHYVIDAAIDQQLVNELGEALDTLYRGYTRHFSLRPRQRLVVRVFSDGASFTAYGAEHYQGFNPAWRAVYIGRHAVAERELILVAYNDDLLFEDARHEALHQFLHAAIPNVHAMPYWFNEGLAEYLEVSTPTRTGIDLPHPLRLSNQWRLLLGDLRGRGRVAMANVIDLDGRAFNSGDIHEHYALSYALVHFLMQDEDGREQFDRFLGMLSRGTAYDQAFRHTIGRLDDLEERWLAWLDRAIEHSRPATSTDIFD